MDPRSSGAGRDVARAYFGTQGWVTNATGNIWGYAGPGTSLDWGLFPAARRGFCRHLWEQYEFTQDRAYLQKTAYPSFSLKEAAEFYLSNLVEYQGLPAPRPAVSAEHESSRGYLEPAFSGHSRWRGTCSQNVVQAADILGWIPSSANGCAKTRDRLNAAKDWSAWDNCR